MLLVDDHLLLDVLLVGRFPTLRRALGAGQLATTGLWYYRLCQAVTSERVRGRLSGPLTSLPSAQQQSAGRTVVALPPEITLLSLRQVAPTMAALVQGHRLNAIGLEALAAATLLDAEIHVAKTNDGPLLRAAAKAEGVRLVAR